MKLSFAAVTALSLMGASAAKPSLSDLVDNMKADADGIAHLGADGVLRTLDADHTTVLDYLRLSPDQLKSVTSGETLEGLAGVDGRDVVAEDALFAVPADISSSPAPADVTPVKRSRILERQSCRGRTCGSSGQCQAMGCRTCIATYTPGVPNKCS